MTETGFNYESIVVQGVYGDKEVRLCRCFPEDPGGTDVVLLHGVHSGANLNPRNKFRHLAGLLVEKGFTAWLVETSRAIRYRAEGEDTARWAEDAFGGKTFSGEQEDVFRAIKEVLRRNSGKAFWLWGFSLGGIIAASAACHFLLGEAKPAVDTLIVSGTGLSAYPQVEKEMLDMPILSTLRETISPCMLTRARTNRAVSFRGEYDDVFSEKSCREFIDKINLPEKKKTFLSIAGADHSLSHRYGKADHSVIKEMVDYIVSEQLPQI